MIGVPTFVNCHDGENGGACRSEEQDMGQGLGKCKAEYEIGQNARQQEQGAHYSHHLK